MSIIWSLKRLADPATHMYEEGEKESERQQPERAESGDPPRFEVDEPAQLAASMTPERFRCRVCGHTGAESVYCPVCLADTMAPAE